MFKLSEELPPGRETFYGPVYEDTNIKIYSLFLLYNDCIFTMLSSRNMTSKMDTSSVL